MGMVHIAVGGVGCELANELNAIAVIVDALRASSTIALLFERGIAEAWVVAEVDDAWELKRKMPDALMVGERGSIKIAGFDFSNSPTEILQVENLAGRRVIFTSTTGARRLLSCQKTKAMLVGAAVNATAVAKAAKALAHRLCCDIVLVASGVHGRGDEWAAEDIAASWTIADLIGLPLSETVPRPKGDLQTVFESSLHGRELLELGLHEDVYWSAQVDTVTTVPKRHCQTKHAVVLCAFQIS